MDCPVCGHFNLTGAEVCDNCGADLAGADVPQPTTSFHSRLLGEHLDDLGAPPPITVSADTPVDVVIARMQAAEADCVLVTSGERLVELLGAERVTGSVAGAAVRETVDEVARELRCDVGNRDVVAAQAAQHAHERAE